MKKLFLVHLGYSDESSGGVFELHTNIFVAADDFESAHLAAKEMPLVIEKNMHIDGMQLIEKVDGYNIELNITSDNETTILSRNYGELAAGKF